MFSTLMKMSLLAVECTEVIGLRMMRATASGSAVADEPRLMMSEKTEAAMRYGPAFMAGGSLEQMIDDYRGIVQANALRLALG